MLELAGMLALAIAGWIGRSIRDLRLDAREVHAATDTRLDGAESRLATLESVDASGAMERLAKCEGRIHRLEAAQITHEDLGRVYRRLDGMLDSMATMNASVNATISEVKGSLEATRGQLIVVCEHLIERGSK